MLIVDSANAPRLVAGNKREKHDAQIQKWVEDQTETAKYLNDPNDNPTILARQLGRMMTSDELEKKLKKMDPNLHFEWNQFNSSKKMMYHIRPGVGKYSVCPYEAGPMPEHSVLKQKVEMVRDFSVGMVGKPALDRKDLPKYEWVPGQGYVFDSTATLPGWKKVTLPWGEHKRGWRTVLIRLVERGIFTPPQIESVFGADDTPNWAKHMGKQNSIILPY